METLDRETDTNEESPEEQFERLIAASSVSKGIMEYLQKTPVDFLMREMPLHFGVEDVTGIPNNTVGITNGSFCLYDGKAKIFTRIMCPSEDFNKNGSVTSEIGLVETDASSLSTGLQNNEKLQVKSIIKSTTGVWVEDPRITANSDGTFTICGVLYKGRKEENGEEIHDVCLGLGQWDPGSDEKVELQPILPGKKNGVILDENVLICRDVKDVKNIKVARRENNQSEWKIDGNLEGFWENFPEELKDRVVRVGPGTNPLYISELKGWIAGFHWVLRDKDVQKEDEEAEYYVGGLMLMDSINPPRVTKIEPYAISPMDSSPESLEKSLFSEIDNKHVAFPMGAERMSVGGEDCLVISGGFNDTEEHFNSVPISKLIERLS